MPDRPQKITFADMRDLAAIFSRDAIWSLISTTANIGATLRRNSARLLNTSKTLTQKQ
jgi:hypothetical protein